MSGWSPILTAAYGGHVDCVKALLRGGANKDFKNNVRPTKTFWRRKTKMSSVPIIEKWLEGVAKRWQQWMLQQLEHRLDRGLDARTPYTLIMPCTFLFC